MGWEPVLSAPHIPVCQVFIKAHLFKGKKKHFLFKFVIWFVTFKFVATWSVGLRGDSCPGPHQWLGGLACCVHSCPALRSCSQGSEDTSKLEAHCP